jgi:hypothetical protein
VASRDAYSEAMAWVREGNVVVCVPRLDHGDPVILTRRYQASKRAVEFLCNEDDAVRAYSLLCVTAAVHDRAVQLGLGPLA